MLRKPILSPRGKHHTHTGDNFGARSLPAWGILFVFQGTGGEPEGTGTGQLSNRGIEFERTLA
jgi:hypothetical protein